MKKVSSLIFASLISLFMLKPSLSFAELEGTLTLSGAWAIYPTAVAWADAFKKSNLKVKIDISAGGAGKGAADAIAGLVDIGMVSRDPDPAELARGVQALYILKDAIFPVVSDKNVALKELLQKGVSRKMLVDLYIHGTRTTWGQLTGTKNSKPIHVYTRSDSSGAAASWAAYLGKKQEDLKGVGVYGDPGLLESAKRDPVGIGYNNFSFVFSREGQLNPGIRLVPIDSNENGRADSDEIFTNKTQAIAAIESGRYPAIRKNLFFVNTKNRNPLIKEFISFALSEEGTKIADETGASLTLKPEERQKTLESLRYSASQN